MPEYQVPDAQEAEIIRNAGYDPEEVMVSLHSEDKLVILLLKLRAIDRERCIPLEEK